MNRQGMGNHVVGYIPQMCPPFKANILPAPISSQDFLFSAGVYCALCACFAHALQSSYKSKPQAKSDMEHVQGAPQGRPRWAC